MSYSWFNLDRACTALYLFNVIKFAENLIHEPAYYTIVSLQMSPSFEISIIFPNFLSFQGLSRWATGQATHK